MAEKLEIGCQAGPCPTVCVNVRASQVYVLEGSQGSPQPIQASQVYVEEDYVEGDYVEGVYVVEVCVVEVCVYV